MPLWEIALLSKLGVHGGGEYEGMGWLSWASNRERESKERDILIDEVIMGFGRNLVLEKQG